MCRSRRKYAEKSEILEVLTLGRTCVVQVLGSTPIVKHISGHTATHPAGCSAAKWTNLEFSTATSTSGGEFWFWHASSQTSRHLLWLSSNYCTWQANGAANAAQHKAPLSQSALIYPQLLEGYVKICGAYTEYMQLVFHRQVLKLSSQVKDLRVQI